MLTDAGQIAGDAAVTDTGVVVDADSPDLGTPDLGTPTDAGEPADVGGPIDAGEPADLGTPADAGAEDAGNPAVTFTEVFDSILSVSCSCHGGMSHPTGLTMQNRAAAYANLVEAATTSGSCTNLPRVDPGDADNSSLYRRITGTSCGTSMPFGSTLSAPNAAKIQAWINAGAADD